jgi:hypothetical protein
MLSFVVYIPEGSSLHARHRENLKVSCGGMLLRNVGIYLQAHTASQHRVQTWNIYCFIAVRTSYSIIKFYSFNEN